MIPQACDLVAFQNDMTFEDLDEGLTHALRESQSDDLFNAPHLSVLPVSAPLTAAMGIESPMQAGNQAGNRSIVSLLSRQGSDSEEDTTGGEKKPKRVLPKLKRWKSFRSPLKGTISWKKTQEDEDEDNDEEDDEVVVGEKILEDEPDGQFSEGAKCVWTESTPFHDLCSTKTVDDLIKKVRFDNNTKQTIPSNNHTKQYQANPNALVRPLCSQYPC